jgi:hypothetical protein
MAFAAPKLFATGYDGKLEVEAQWQPVPDAVSYTLKVYQGTQVLASKVVPGPVGSVTLTAPIVSQTVQVAVAAGEGSEAGPDSNRMLVIIDVAAGLKAVCDGSQVRASWTLPQGSVANLGQVAVLDASGTSLAEGTFEGTEGTLTPSPPASEGATLKVRPALGSSLGPVATLPLVTKPAAARTVVYHPAAKRVEVILSEDPPPNCSPSAALYADGELFESAEGVGKQVDIPLESALDPATEWTVRPTWVSGGASGPSGAPVKLLVTPPSLRSIAGDGPLTIAWENQPGQPFPTKGQLGLSANGGQLTSDAVIAGGAGGVATPAPALPEGYVYSATVAGLRGPAEGPASEPVLVPWVRTPIASTAYDGKTLTVTWVGNDPAGTTGCRLELLTGGLQVGEFLGTGGKASWEVGLDPAATYQVRLRWLAGHSSGLAGPAAPVEVVAGPTVSSVAVDPVNDVATVSWRALSGATYVMQAYLDGVWAARFPTSKTSETLKTWAAAGRELTVAVRAVVTSSGVSCEGPPGPRLAVLTTRPQIAAVEFDGVDVTVRWLPVAAADGFEVSVVGGKPGAVIASKDAPAGATSLRLAKPPSFEDTVAVQVKRGSSTGVAARAALFQPGLYVQPNAGGLTILQAASERLEAATVSVYLPALGKATLRPLPIEPPQAGSNEPPFKLAENTDSKSKATLPYVLTIGNGALKFDANRPGLAATYTALLRAAEAAGAGPQGIFTLQQVISRLMPQTFAETLYYAYGLSPLRGCVDLRPGMILRVAAPGFDLTAVDSVPPPASWASGYAPGGAIDLAIDDYLSVGAEVKWRVGFDSFLATLAANGALEVPAPEATGTSTSPVDVVETGGADAADLFFAGFRNPYYRLLIPATVQAASKPTTPRTSQQFAIASAPSWAQIDASPPGSEVKVAYFRGRAVLRPCIRVEVSGHERVVPVGTTVGNLLDGLGRRPPSTARPLAGLRMERSLGPAVLDPTAPYDAGASTRVNLDWLGLVTTAPGVDALSLPLLHGDRLDLGEGG